MEAQAPYRIIGTTVAPPTPSAVPRFTYYHLDHLGTPRVLLDNAGNLISKHHYMPFGEEMPAAVQSSTNKRQFTGHERDPEDGLDYMLARYYNSSLGRFMAVDPVLKIGESLYNPQWWDRYTYSANNPLKYFDPDGRDFAASANSQTKTMTVRVNIVLVGGTSALAKQAESQANATWNKGPKTFSARNGSTWSLKVEVSVKVSAEGISSTNAHTNYMYVVDSGRSEVNSKNTGNLNPADMKYPNAVAHETGHMVGLPDTYDKTKPTNPPLPGQEGSLMGDPLNPAAAPTQSETQSVGENAEDQVSGKSSSPKKTGTSRSSDVEKVLYNSARSVEAY